MRQLRPFIVTPHTQALEVSAELFQTSAQHFLLEFNISGDIHQIAWPPSSDESRHDGLWQNTCWEAFFSAGSENADTYTEINCSPNGDWNAYNFSSYREGMTLAADVTVCLKQRDSLGDSVRFQMEVSCTSPLSLQSVGLMAVIEFTDGSKSYWALHHPRSQPDFHDKGGWTLRRIERI